MVSASSMRPLQLLSRSSQTSSAPETHPCLYRHSQRYDRIHLDQDLLPTKRRKGRETCGCQRRFTGSYSLTSLQLLYSILMDVWGEYPITVALLISAKVMGTSPGWSGMRSIIAGRPTASSMVWMSASSEWVIHFKVHDLVAHWIVYCFADSRYDISNKGIVS